MRKVLDVSGKVALAAIATLLCLAVAEVGIRFLAPEISGYHDPRDIIEFDEMLGWRKKPGVTVRNVTGEYAVTETINSLGFRGPEIPPTKVGGEYRVLVLGDSFTEGYTVDQQDLFSIRLNARLSEAHSGSQITVINAGTTGYSTDQELLLLRQVGARLEPDLVVLMFCDNDLLYNLRPNYWSSAKPLFQMDTAGGVAPVNIPLQRRAPREFSSIHRVKAWLLRNSHLYRLVRDRVRSLPGLLMLARSVGVLDGTAAVPAEFRVYRREQDEETAAAWEITTALLEEIQREAQKLGSKLLIFHVPFRAAVYREDWTWMKQQWGLTEEEWDMNQVGVSLAQIAAKLGILYVDPVDRFLARARALESNKRLYYRIDGHWTAAGHELVAGILGEEIDALMATMQLGGGSEYGDQDR